MNTLHPDLFLDTRNKVYVTIKKTVSEGINYLGIKFLSIARY